MSFILCLCVPIGFLPGSHRLKVFINVVKWQMGLWAHMELPMEPNSCYSWQALFFVLCWTIICLFSDRELRWTNVRSGRIGVVSHTFWDDFQF